MIRSFKIYPCTSRLSASLENVSHMFPMNVSYMYHIRVEINTESPLYIRRNGNPSYQRTSSTRLKLLYKWAFVNIEKRNKYLMIYRIYIRAKDEGHLESLVLRQKCLVDSILHHKILILSNTEPQKETEEIKNFLKRA